MPLAAKAPSAARPLVQKLSVAVAVQVAGSAVPSRQKRAWMVVPLVRRRIHQREPAAPEDRSVPWASVAEPVPPALATRASVQVRAPAGVGGIRAAEPLGASVFARGTRRAW